MNTIIIPAIIAVAIIVIAIRTVIVVICVVVMMSAVIAISVVIAINIVITLESYAATIAMTDFTMVVAHTDVVVAMYRRTISLSACYVPGTSAVATP